MLSERAVCVEEREAARLGGAIDVAFPLERADVGEGGGGFDVKMRADFVDGRRHAFLPCEFGDEIQNFLLFVCQSLHGGLLWEEFIGYEKA